MKIKYSDPHNSIVNFSNSILSYFGCAPFHETIPQLDEILKGHRRVFVLLFDGMGTYILNRHLPKGTLLRRNRLHTMTSTFPPTTVAATNGLLSGKFPIENGWLGWSQYFQEHDTNVDLFSGRHNLTKQPLMDPLAIRSLLDYEDIMTIISNKNPKMRVSSVWPYPVRVEGPKQVGDFFKLLDIEASNHGPQFTYGYWIQPDLDTHDHGVTSIQIKRIVRDINNRLEKLTSDHLDTLFLIIADHGLLDIEFIGEEADSKLWSMLVRPFSNEPRAANFFVKPNRHKAFEKRFKQLYGSNFILKSKHELLEESWYGLGQKHPMVDHFIGDYVAIATDRLTFDHYREGQLAHGDMKAHHAGLTEEEMLIDIIAINR